MSWPQAIDKRIGNIIEQYEEKSGDLQTHKDYK